MATNLFGRGMDIERVNIVFNYDMPEDSDTYLHRVNICIALMCYSIPVPAHLASAFTCWKRFTINVNQACVKSLHPFFFFFFF